MKVYLIYSPEVHPQSVDAVLEILTSVPGPMEFKVVHMPWTYGDKFQIEQQRYRPDFRFRIESEYRLQHYKAHLGYPLSWSELFYLCDRARMDASISQDDFVILITNRRNSMNFFSMFDIDGKRNAFVQASDWEHFLKSPETYPVAYEVVANVLRILSEFKLDQNISEQFHTEAIGCMNDFCENKSQIILKLRTADLCHNCLEVLEGRGADPQVVAQSLQIFEKIRTRLKFSQGFAGNIKPKKISVSGQGNITVADNDLTLTPLEKTILIFFLRNPEGIRLAELDDYETEIFTIYQHLKANADPLNIRKLVDNIDGNFSYNKSRLNRKLRDQIGEPLANFYVINGLPGERFSVAVPRELISMPKGFTL